MFGFVVANREALSQEEFVHYRACYCGLCAALRRRHGELRGLTLTYDLALLPLLLGAVYQPQEKARRSTCIIHPLKKQPQWQNAYTDYAADMNVILAYYKMLDDWQDDRALTALAAAGCLKGCAAKIERSWPRQCQAIRECLAQLSRVEAENSSNPDEAAHCFGVLLGELFWVQEDAFAPTLRRLGYFLGKFIYLQDASLDLHRDLQKERYNPLAFVEQTDHRPLLTALIGQAAAELERLPLARDEHLLKNILYSGVWTKYELAAAQKAKRKEKQGQ